MPESTWMMQGGFHPGEAFKVAETKVPVWAASFGAAYRVGLWIG